MKLRLVEGAGQTLIAKKDGYSLYKNSDGLYVVDSPQDSPAEIIIGKNKVPNLSVIAEYVTSSEMDDYFKKLNIVRDVANEFFYQIRKVGEEK